ncbi:MAG: C40 family peptidase [Rectinema sp.]
MRNFAGRIGAVHSAVPTALFFIFLLAFCLPAVPGARSVYAQDTRDSPLDLPAAGKYRQALLAAAESYVGTPYRSDGEDRGGMDCSGLVFRAFLDSTGRTVPRTVASLASWVTLVRMGELEPGDLVFFHIAGVTPGAPLGAADHVGIYLGEGLFVHSASAGSRAGVQVSSLSEAYWARRRLGAGRALPPSGYLGIMVDMGASIFTNAEFDTAPDVRGGALWVGAAFPLFDGLRAGLQTRVAYDGLMHVGRIPLEATLSLGNNLDFFAGPALTLGTPVLPEGASGGIGGTGAARAYEPAGQWLASAGIRWTPFLLRRGMWRIGLAAEFRYDRYLAASGLASDPASDRLATMSLGLALRVRTTR